MWLILPLCFPAHSIVTTPNGPKAMKDLVVGDTVRVVSSEGRVDWSSVCGWLHREAGSAGNYLKIQTSQRQLTVSAAHLVATVVDGKIKFVPAEEIHKGSTLLEVDDTSSRVWANHVTDVSTIQCVGVYAPLTVSGTLIVDGVGASCYASTHSHKMAHAAMKPMRTMYHHNPHKMQSTTHTGKHIQGSHRYVDFLARATGKC